MEDWFMAKWRLPDGEDLEWCVITESDLRACDERDAQEIFERKIQDDFASKVFPTPCNEEEFLDWGARCHCGEGEWVMIAALFVESNGCYFNLNGVDAWDVQRDARNYMGPYPVVAHPPCQLWGKFAIVNYKRWGGEHNRPGNDNGCFKSALDNVRKFGGVLEHPAFSYAWGQYEIAKPWEIGWCKISDSEWVCEVWQSVYGHLARKRTWLFYCGLNPPFDLLWDRKSGSHQIGHQDQRGKCRNKPTISGKAASATPHQFRDALISLAAKSGGAP